MVATKRYSKSENVSKRVSFTISVEGRANANARKSSPDKNGAIPLPAPSLPPPSLPPMPEIQSDQEK